MIPKIINTWCRRKRWAWILIIIWFRFGQPPYLLPKTRPVCLLFTYNRNPVLLWLLLNVERWTIFWSGPRKALTNLDRGMWQIWKLMFAKTGRVLEWIIVQCFCGRGVQCPTFGVSAPPWKKKSCLGPHIKYIPTRDHKTSHNVLSKFMILC